MSWSYKYNSLEDFISDLQNNPRKIWNPYGRVDSVEILKDSNIVMYSLQYGTQIKYLSRHVFSFQEFLDLSFSKDLPGLNLYISEDLGRTLDSYDIISNEQKDLYNKTALRLIDENRLKIYWPPPKVMLDTSILEVKIGPLQLSNGAAFNFTPGAPIEYGQSESVVLRITNRGTGTLKFLKDPRVELVNLDPDFNFVIGSTFSKEFLRKDETVEVQLIFSPSTAGLKNGRIVIETNDPSNPTYILHLSGVADSSTFDRGPDILFYDSLFFEKGSLVTGVDLRVRTTKTYSPISGVSFYEGINFLGEISGVNPNGGDESFFYVPLFVIENNTSFKAVVTDGFYEGSAERSLSFLDRCYWGYSSTNLVDTSAEILFLGNSKLSDVASGVYAFGDNPSSVSGTQGSYIVFAYPSYMGTFTSLQDLNSGFVYYSGSFNISSLNHTNAHGYVTQYNVVVSKNSTFASNLEWRYYIE